MEQTCGNPTAAIATATLDIMENLEKPQQANIPKRAKQLESRPLVVLVQKKDAEEWISIGLDKRDKHPNQSNYNGARPQHTWRRPNPGWTKCDYDVPRQNQQATGALIIRNEQGYLQRCRSSHMLTCFEPTRRRMTKPDTCNATLMVTRLHKSDI